jgi:hypothetical protein
MDQTTPTDQGVLRHKPQRRANPNLDRRVRLRLGGHRQKGIATGMQHVSNSPNPQHFTF